MVKLIVCTAALLVVLVHCTAVLSISYRPNVHYGRRFTKLCKPCPNTCLMPGAGCPRFPRAECRVLPCSCQRRWVHTLNLGPYATNQPIDVTEQCNIPPMSGLVYMQPPQMPAHPLPWPKPMPPPAMPHPWPKPMPPPAMPHPWPKPMPQPAMPHPWPKPIPYPWPRPMPTYPLPMPEPIPLWPTIKPILPWRRPVPAKPTMRPIIHGLPVPPNNTMLPNGTMLPPRPSQQPLMPNASLAPAPAPSPAPSPLPPSGSTPSPTPNISSSQPIPAAAAAAAAAISMDASCANLLCQVGVCMVDKVTNLPYCEPSCKVNNGGCPGSKECILRTVYCTRSPCPPVVECVMK